MNTATSWFLGAMSTTQHTQYMCFASLYSCRMRCSSPGGVDLGKLLFFLVQMCLLMGRLKCGHTLKLVGQYQGIRSSLHPGRSWPAPHFPSVVGVSPRWWSSRIFPGAWVGRGLETPQRWCQPIWNLT